ncbi:MAG: hypothetical protein PUC40_02945, partial [Lachnospiraceae bacterium]|nr:hypothetical protein [Lachnospiraceae bacterium]
MAELKKISNHKMHSKRNKKSALLKGVAATGAALGAATMFGQGNAVYAATSESQTDSDSLLDDFDQAQASESRVESVSDSGSTSETSGSEEVKSVSDSTSTSETSGSAENESASDSTSASETSGSAENESTSDSVSASEGSESDSESTSSQTDSQRMAKRSMFAVTSAASSDAKLSDNGEGGTESESLSESISASDSESLSLSEADSLTVRLAAEQTNIVKVFEYSSTAPDQTIKSVTGVLNFDAGIIHWDAGYQAKDGSTNTRQYFGFYLDTIGGAENPTNITLTDASGNVQEFFNNNASYSRPDPS